MHWHINQRFNENTSRSVATLLTAEDMTDELDRLAGVLVEIGWNLASVMRGPIQDRVLSWGTDSCSFAGWSCEASTCTL